jgi:hypothetical protein
MIRNKEAGPSSRDKGRPSAKRKPDSPQFTPVRVYRHRSAGFPDAPLRRFLDWPAGLACYLETGAGR